MTTGMNDPQIVTGSVFDPPDAPYFRYLVARNWPAGVSRGAVDQWDRELAPSNTLLESWRADQLNDAEFERQYEAELDQRPALLGWAVRTAGVNGIVLVDDTPEEPAPRSVLASILKRRLALARDGGNDD